ncbi:MAG: Spy/CpxP family protein refolding chaperone [Alphaproteobacteria bacterium]|nr:Spy/CpxP family protein refolding chaperone [Alphaproteobacteria bacterium]
MYKSMIAGAAFIAGAAIATPMIAWSAGDAPPQVAQAGEDQPAWPRHRGEDRDRGHGAMGEWLRQHFGQAGQQQSPQQQCEERLARRAGMIAYVVAKLNLTADQRPAWDKLQGILQAGADKQRQLCAGLKPRDQRGAETVLDRLDQRQQFLSARLDTIQQVKPALQAFYQALTPDQRAIVDHPFRHSRAG